MVEIVSSQLTERLDLLGMILLSTGADGIASLIVLDAPEIYEVLNAARLTRGSVPILVASGDEIDNVIRHEHSRVIGKPARILVWHTGDCENTRELIAKLSSTRITTEIILFRRPLMGVR